MGLRHAVLAALLDGEASGYELSKRFGVGVANFWSAAPQQLYRELEQLDAAGMVSAVVVEQERRPNKRVFTLTDAGRDELRDFTSRPPRPMAFRDDLAVQLQAIDVGDAEAVVRFLTARAEESKVKLEAYERFRSHLLEGRTEKRFLRSTARIGPYLTVLGGIMLEEQNLRWVDEVLTILEKRFGSHR